MDDDRIHGQIEQLVAEEHELCSARRPVTRATTTGDGSES